MVKIMTFPNIEDNINELRGVIINKIISNDVIPIHIHTFWVDFENSTIN